MALSNLVQNIIYVLTVESLPEQVSAPLHFIGRANPLDCYHVRHVQYDPSKQACHPKFSFSDLNSGLLQGAKQIIMPCRIT